MDPDSGSFVDQAAPSVAYGAGLNVSELAYFKVDDIDSARMLIRIGQGEGARTAMPCCRPAAGAAETVVARGRRQGVLLPHG
jgi:site-specific recombinase XerC